MKRTWILFVLAVLATLSCSRGDEKGAVVAGSPATGSPLLAEGEAIDLFKVSEAVWAREAKHGISGLTEPERVFLCVWSLEAEVNNGGFAQLFENSAGDYASATAGALRTVGAPEMAALVERAMEPFGPAGPPADRDQRQRAMKALPSSAQELWGALDKEFYALASPEQGLRALVDANRHAFYSP
jgi:hypothetical protein